MPWKASACCDGPNWPQQPKPRSRQIGIVDAAGGGQVLPAERWSDAAILEEHAFALELQEWEIPSWRPLALAGGNPYAWKDSVCGVPASRRPRPEWSSRTPAMDGGAFGRIHAVGALIALPRASPLDIASFGGFDFLLGHGFAERPAGGLAKRRQSGAGGRAPLL